MVVVLTAFLGLGLGSFANVLMDRVPEGRSIRGRSRCDRCLRTLRWWELLPVVSAVILRHRCRTCGTAIPLRLTLVELGTAALVLVVIARHGGVATFPAALEAFGLLSLGILAVIDLERGVVPDRISLPAIAILALGRIAYCTGSPVTCAVSGTLGSLVLTMAIGAGFFGVQRLISRGRWVGDGDTRVGALMGALFSLPHLLIALAASYIVGGVVAGVLLMLGRVARGSHLPLVPFLWVGSTIAVMFGDRVVRWYR